MQFLKYFFASLLALVAFFLVGFFLLFAIGSVFGSKSSEPVVENNTFLHINLSRAITEQHTPADINFTGESQSTYGLYELQRAIEKAATDNRIKGIYLSGAGLSTNGWSTSADLRAALAAFKKSKKPIIAYSDYYSQKNYYIASIADSIYVNPVGSVELTGLAITSFFFKGTLDKLNIKPSSFYCGQFKGASEPFRLDKFSEPNRQQLNDLLQDIYTEMCTALSQRTGKTVDEIKTLASTLAIRHSSDAVKHKLVTGTAYEGKVLDIIKDITGKKSDNVFTTATTYCKALSSGTGSNKVAVLFAEGEIADGKAPDQSGIYSETIIKDIRKIRANSAIKAVVLRINSPGGSALASENIYQELKLLAAQKKLVVSMGDVAASGGYYIACAADSVFAQPSTITGSIGVVAIMFGTQGFLNNKLGITTDVVKTAPFADFPSVTRDMSAQEQGFIQEYLDSTYVTFKQRVAEARNMTLAQVEQIAQGHVYSGTDALGLGLVDGMANLQQCIAKAAKMANLSSYRTVTYPIKKESIDLLLERLQNTSDAEAKVMAALGLDVPSFKALMSFKANANKPLVRLPWDLQIQ